MATNDVTSSHDGSGVLQGVALRGLGKQMKHKFKKI
jgi:hypothetical protein